MGRMKSPTAVELAITAARNLASRLAMRKADQPAAPRLQSSTASGTHEHLDELPLEQQQR
jgi:hypothetical protein